MFLFQIGKDVTPPEDAGKVEVRDLVANADAMQEDSDDFVFTSASEQGTTERRQRPLNYVSLRYPGCPLHKSKRLFLQFQTSNE